MSNQNSGADDRMAGMKPQFGIKEILLITAVIAIWMALPCPDGRMAAMEPSQWIAIGIGVLATMMTWNFLRRMRSK